MSKAKKALATAVMCVLGSMLMHESAGNSAELKQTLSAAEKVALNKLTQYPIAKPADLPLPVRRALGLLKNPKQIAGPGEKWTIGCTPEEGVPNQQLSLAAASSNACVVYCEHCGYDRWFSLQFFMIKGDTAQLVRNLEVNKQYKTLSEIIAVLEKQ